MAIPKSPPPIQNPSLFGLNKGFRAGFLDFCVEEEMPIFSFQVGVDEFFFLALGFSRLARKGFLFNGIVVGKYSGRAGGLTLTTTWLEKSIALSSSGVFEE